MRWRTPTKGTPKSAARQLNVETKDLIAGIVLAVVLIGNLIYWLGHSTILSDAVADWAVTSAVLEGESPYTDVRELAARHGAVLEGAGLDELGPGEWIHPRTPGAILLLSPMGMIGPGNAHDAHLIVSTVAIWILLVHLIPRVSSIERSSLMLGGILMLASAPVVSSFEFGTISIAVTALIFVSWVWADSDRPWIAGLALGIAISLKVWPGLLLVPLLVTRRLRVVSWSLATVFVLQTTGSLLFGVTPIDLMHAFSEASTRWISFSGNGSLTGLLVRLGVEPLLASVSMVVIGAWAVWLVASKYEAGAYPFAVVVGLLVSPLAWEHYDVVLLGVAAVIVPIQGWPRFLAVAFLSISFIGMPFRRLGSDLTAVGLRTLAGRILMLVAVALSLHALELTKVERRSRSNSGPLTTHHLDE